MTDQEYLQKVLQAQNLADDSAELKALQSHRAEVEKLLRDGFPKCAPTIRYGGSIAKGTLIKENYDLDIVCYFPSDDTTAGDTLEDIYNNVASVLSKSYDVQRKRSALRLRDRSKVDFHIDVVPGRFTDDTKTDCFLHQEAGDKSRLKTNLQVHIDHVRKSGVLDALRLLKLWKTRKALGVKQFAFELLAIKLLKGTTKSLPDQVKHVLTEISSRADAIAIEDPANPAGNDLSDLLNATVWAELKSAASTTLSLLTSSGWEGVFGKLPGTGSTSDKLKSAAVSAPSTKPWLA